MPKDNSLKGIEFALRSKGRSPADKKHKWISSNLNKNVNSNNSISQTETLTRVLRNRSVNVNSCLVAVDKAHEYKLLAAIIASIILAE